MTTATKVEYTTSSSTNMESTGTKSKDMTTVTKIESTTSSPTNLATTMSDAVSSASTKGVKRQRRPRNKG